jgi:CheY-like chemotaxis protein
MVVLDWRMPVMHGGEVLQSMRRDARLKKVKVMVLSADDVHTSAIEAGATDFMNKAVIDIPTLTTKILGHVEPSSTEPPT